MAGLQCPRCGGERPLVGAFFSGAMDILPGFKSARLRYATRRFLGRRWGTYSRLLGGKYWEPGERELYRTDVQGVSTFAVDHHAMVLSHPTCIVTNRRIAACSPEGPLLVEVPLRDIARVNVRRDKDSSGSACWVAIVEMHRSEQDPEGDVSLRCDTLQRGRELQERIQEAMDDLGR